MKRQMHVLTDLAVVDAVVGFRTWEAWCVDGVVHLSSVAKRHIEWPQAAPLQAECLCTRGSRGFAPPGIAPHKHGIYAWSHPIIPYTPVMLDQHPLGTIKPSVYIAGEVLLWGEYVHRHERGYRAEWALPSAFYLTDGMSDRLHTVIGLAAKQWKVPVVKMDAGRSFDQRYPDTSLEAVMQRWFLSDFGSGKGLPVAASIHGSFVSVASASIDIERRENAQ